MKLEDFDKSQVLESGFREKESESSDAPFMSCIYCNEDVPFDSLKEHTKLHTNHEKFDILLHADSVFAFTAKEKRYLNYVFHGYKDKAIAQKMGIPEVSARRMRNQFNNLMRQARGLLLLNDLLGDKLKRRKKEKALKGGTEIPSIDDLGIVQAFHPTKHIVHEKGLLHATTIIVVIKNDPETGEPAFLVVDKADKQSGYDTLAVSALDVLGGHVRREDFFHMPSEEYVAETFVGKPLPLESIMWNCARRELSRELISPCQSDESLSFWFENRYTGIHAEGTNNEISWVFLCEYKNGTQNKLNVPGEVRVKDDWINSIGEQVSRTYVGRFWRLSDIQNEVAAHPEHVYDGLKRVIQKLSDDPTVYESLKNFLNG